MHITINGKRTLQDENCPLHCFCYDEQKKIPSCCITKKTCRWGVTDIYPPENCPLRNGKIVVELKGALSDAHEIFPHRTLKQFLLDLVDHSQLT